MFLVVRGRGITPAHQKFMSAFDYNPVRLFWCLSFVFLVFGSGWPGLPTFKLNRVRHTLLELSLRNGEIWAAGPQQPIC